MRRPSKVNAWAGAAACLVADTARATGSASPSRPAGLTPIELPVTMMAVALLGGLACAGLVRAVLRLRRITAAERIHAAMIARLAQQQRVARELQDGLLQTLQGLIVTLQLVAEGNPLARAAIADALTRAETLLLDSRDRISALQPSPADNDDPA